MSALNHAHARLSADNVAAAVTDLTVVPRVVPAEPSPIVSDDRTVCFFCTTAPAVWAHVLDGGPAGGHGAGYVIGNDLLTLCERCEGLFVARAMDELMALARCWPRATSTSTDTRARSTNW